MSDKHTLNFEDCKLEMDFSDPKKLQLFADTPLVIDGITITLNKQEALRLALMLHAYAVGKFDGSYERLHPAVDEYRFWGGDDVPPPGYVENEND